MEQSSSHHPHRKHGRRRRRTHADPNSRGYSPDERRQYKQLRAALIFIVVVFLLIIGIVILSVSGPEAWRRWFK